MKMPWGRYKGSELAAIPADYLEWVRENLSLRPELAYEIDCLVRGGLQRIVDRRQALMKIVSSLDDRQVAKLLGYATKLLRAHRPD
jgi:uncharacterized protein (DUF3820 family)